MEKKIKKRELGLHSQLFYKNTESIKDISYECNENLITQGN